MYLQTEKLLPLSGLYFQIILNLLPEKSFPWSMVWYNSKIYWNCFISFFSAQEGIAQVVLRLVDIASINNEGKLKKNQ